jgi:hypothetical protein
LQTALEQARKAGLSARSAVVEDGKVVLQFGEPTADETCSDWDEHLRDKH